MKFIGIVGSRRRNSNEDYGIVLATFRDLYELEDQLVSGGCPQCGDAFAERIAKSEQIPITIYYAPWNRLGKRAGYARNVDIAEHADILIACVAADRTGGTEDTVKKYLGLGKDKLYLV